MDDEDYCCVCGHLSDEGSKVKAVLFDEDVFVCDSCQEDVKAETDLIEQDNQPTR